jgi:hypothetical protein
MSNIITYPGISVVAGQDLMIISDTSIKGNPTKTVSVDALGSYIGATGGGAGVATVNGVSGAVTLVAGTGVDLVVAGQNITINSASSGGTVTSVAATFGGNAFALTGSPITGAGTLAITPGGSVTQYINGAGNLINLTTLPVNLAPLAVSRTSGAATWNPTTKVLDIPNYSGEITSVTANGSDGDATLDSGTKILNIPNYNSAYKELFFQITNTGGTYSSSIHRNTTGATFTFARTGTGSYEMQASSNIFGAAAITFFSVMNANRVAPASGTGVLPQPTVARLKTNSLFVVEVFSNNTGTVAGGAADIPGSGGYSINVEVKIIAVPA